MLQTPPEPFDARYLTFVEYNGKDDLTRKFRALEEMHSKAREAVSSTNQKRSEYETSLEKKQVQHAGQRQTEYTNSTKRAAYASAALNQWFLRKPFWEAIKALLEAVQLFKAQYDNGSHRNGWAFTAASANNIVCAEHLLKESLKTLSRFSNFPDEHGQFLEAVLKDWNTTSWLTQMPLLPALPPEENGFTLHEEAKLYLRCMNAITGVTWQCHVKYVAVVDVSDIGTIATRKVASYFETLNFKVDYEHGNEMSLSKKPVGAS